MHPRLPLKDDDVTTIVSIARAVRIYSLKCEKAAKLALEQESLKTRGGLQPNELIPHVKELVQMLGELINNDYGGFAIQSQKLVQVYESFIAKIPLESFSPTYPDQDVLATPRTAVSWSGSKGRFIRRDVGTTHACFYGTGNDLTSWLRIRYLYSPVAVNIPHRDGVATATADTMFGKKFQLPQATGDNRTSDALDCLSPGDGPRILRPRLAEFNRFGNRFPSIILRRTQRSEQRNETRPPTTTQFMRDHAIGHDGPGYCATRPEVVQSAVRDDQYNTVPVPASSLRPIDETVIFQGKLNSAMLNSRIARGPCKADTGLKSDVSGFLPESKHTRFVVYIGTDPDTSNFMHGIFSKWWRFHFVSTAIKLITNVNRDDELAWDGASKYLDGVSTDQVIWKGFSSTSIAHQYYEEYRSSKTVFELVCQSTPHSESDLHYLVIEGVQPGVYSNNKDLIRKGLRYRGGKVKRYFGSLSDAFKEFSEYVARREISIWPDIADELL
ncbi:hypothetical protein VNI00_011047 [Paramarasmius palmivorus]|uniref:Uncharacterized protein n=1 Tax=Paramarasmius palmivorus TaxID=297713 RepID=A0AAW0CET2_9AGAR